MAGSRANSRALPAHRVPNSVDADDQNGPARNPLSLHGHPVDLRRCSAHAGMIE